MLILNLNRYKMNKRKLGKNWKTLKKKNNEAKNKKEIDEKKEKIKVSYWAKNIDNPYEYFIYARVSKNEAKTWDTIDVQVDTCKAIAEKRWLKICEIIEERKSWKKWKNRPKFNSMMQKIEKDYDNIRLNHSPRKYWGIIFWKLDRLSRNFDDFAKIDSLLDKWYELISATETIQNTYTGRLLFRILAWFAIYESEKLSARISYTLIKNIIGKNLGSLWGKRTIYWYKLKDSWKNNKHIEIDKQEVEIINAIYDSYYKNYKLHSSTTIHFSGSSLEQTIEDIKKSYSVQIKEYLTKVKSSSTIESFIKNILTNKNSIKYNWYIDFKLDVKDEIIKQLFEEVKSKYPEYGDDVFFFSWNWEVWTEINFRFFFKELAVVLDEKYTYVQNAISKEEKVIKKSIPIEEDRKDEALFLSLAYFQNKYATRLWNVYYKPETNKNKHHNETRHYRTESNLIEDVLGKKIVEELSEWELERYIWESWILKNIWKLEDKKYRELLIKHLQVRQNLYEVKSRTKAIWNIRWYEMYLTTLKNKINSWTVKKYKELKALKDNIKIHEKLKNDAQNNLNKIEEVRDKLISNFDEILKPNLYAQKDKKWIRTRNISRDEKTRILRSLWYRFIFEKIIINKAENTITVYFYPSIAVILWHKNHILTLNLKGPKNTNTMLM